MSFPNIKIDFNALPWWRFIVLCLVVSLICVAVLAGLYFKFTI